MQISWSEWSRCSGKQGNYCPVCQQCWVSRSVFARGMEVRSVVPQGQGGLFWGEGSIQQSAGPPLFSLQSEFCSQQHLPSCSLPHPDPEFILPLDSAIAKSLPELESLAQNPPPPIPSRIGELPQPALPSGALLSSQDPQPQALPVRNL